MIWHYYISAKFGFKDSPYILPILILEWRNFHGRLGCYVLNIEHKVKEVRIWIIVKKFSTNRSFPVCFFLTGIKFVLCWVFTDFGLLVKSYSLANSIIRVRWNMSTQGCWCQFSASSNPQFGVWWRRELYSVQVMIQWGYKDNTAVEQLSCAAAQMWK